MKILICSFLSSALLFNSAYGLSLSSRRQALRCLAAGTVATTAGGSATPSNAVAELPDSFDVENYLKTGMVQMPMGVSGQAGKSRPETGVVLRDGSEVMRDSRSGDVLAEIILKSGGGEKVPVLASYSSPWPLATGTVFDVECRDTNGDAAFLSVTSDTGGKDIASLKDSFFVDRMFSSTGRFSFYGQPTDIKVKKNTSSNLGDNFRVLDVSFSTLSQSTQTEIPRRARLVATIPSGTSQAVVLVGSASALRWKKGSEAIIDNVIASFSAIPAPQTSLKVRAKERRSS